MSQEIQPPHSLTDVFPNLVANIESRKKEREKNLRANEVFLQARGLLNSELAQTIKPEEFSGRELEYRATPPITFKHNDLVVSIWLEEGIYIASNSTYEHNFGEILIMISIGEKDRENFQLFSLMEVDNDDPARKMGHIIYSIRDHSGKKATIDDIEMLHESLSFIEQSLQATSKLQLPPAELGGGGGG